MIRHRYEAWNAALIPGSKQAKAKAAAAAAARRRAAAAAAARAPAGPPRPPNAAAFPFPEYDERTEAEWEKLLNARVKPYEDAINKTNAISSAREEFNFEQARDAQQGLSVAFTKLLTGGQTGDEAQRFAKENFGGSYLPAQAMQMGVQEVSRLTSEWKDQDWELSAQYQKAMAEVPGLKEEMRESIQKEETDEYTRNFNYVNLMLGEAWDAYEANAKAYNTAEQRRIAEAAIRREQGLTGYDNRKDAVAEAAKYTDDTGIIYKVRKTKGGWEAYPTKQRKAKTPTQPSFAEKNSALREASDLTKVNDTIWRARKVKGVWEAYDTGVKKKVAPGKGNKGLSNAQLAENKVVEELYSNPERFKGTKKKNPKYQFPNTAKGRAEAVKLGIPEFIVEGGMDFQQAYAEVLDYASQVLSPFRSPDYIARWVRQRLDAFYPGTLAGASKPRGG